MRFRTRVVELARPAARAVADNRATLCLDVPSAGEARFDPRALFVEHYGRIRSTCLAFAEPGVSVFAFALDRGTWMGSMCLAARPGEIRAGVVGRHTGADLLLEGDARLALRQLLYVIEPMPLSDALRGEVRFRVMDLETACPPTDEEGRSVASLTAEGPVFVRVRDVALLALVTGDATDWPENAEDAWACLPERVFVEERLAAGSLPGPLPIREPASGGERLGRTTVVRILQGPTHVGSLGSDETPCGRVRLESHGARRALAVGRETLRRGILVGRYERCHTQRGMPIADERVSRVHLMIVEIAGKVCAIDLGSSNGSFALDAVSGCAVALRAAPMVDGQRIGLAGVATTVAWCPDPRGD
jgi:hypothetical protein